MKGYDNILVYLTVSSNNNIAEQFSEALNKYDDIKEGNYIENNDGVEFSVEDVHVIPGTNDLVIIINTMLN